MMSKPNFFIVGAAKCGTTALYSWLRTHPDVFLPEIKEPNFFSLSDKKKFCVGNEMDVNYLKQFARTLDAYLALYESATPGQSCGDATPSYLYYKDTAQKLCAFNHSAKIIGVFRNPVDRMVSQYRHNRRDAYETCETLERALDREESRIEAGWWWGFHYRAASLYAKQWRSYQHVFPNDQLLALKYEDLSKNPEGTWMRVLEFLELPSWPTPNFGARVNDTSGLSSVPALDSLERFFRHPSALKSSLKMIVPGLLRRPLRRAIRSLNSAPITPLTVDLKRDLMIAFESDIRHLSDLTGLDLDDWLEPEG